MTSEGLNPHQSTLNELSAIEQSLIKNLGHLGNTFAHLGNDSDQIITREEFENGLSEYIEDLNSIQFDLRHVFKDLAKNGILSVAGKSIPYKACITGEEKDFEIKAKQVSILNKLLSDKNDI